MSEYGSNEREVIDWRVPGIMAKLDKLNKRAKRNGVPPFQIIVGPAFDKKRPERGPVVYDTYHVIRVEGEPVKVKGFDFIGRVDFEEGDRIIAAMPGKVMPINFRQASMACWHCNTDRRRGAVFVFCNTETGKHIQVGRSCLQDFMGCDPARVLWSASLYSQLMEDIDDDGDRGGWADPMEASIPWEAFLVAAVFTIRRHGFMSKRKANEIAMQTDRSVPVTTSMQISDYLFDREAMLAYKPEPEDEARAALILTWLRETWAAKPEAKRSDYEHNVMTLLDRENVKRKRFGLVAPLPTIYARAMEEREANKGCPNVHVGEVGERRAFEAVYRGQNVFETDYGVMYIGRFATPEGLVVYKGGSPFWENGLESGKAIKFVGTIAKHDDYKGTKQTFVSRCVVYTGEAPKIPKRKAKAKAAPAAGAALQDSWRMAA